MQKLIVLLFFISFMVTAQNPKPKDIIGSYKLPNSNPEGGQSVIIFENNTFATFYFGGALKGTWEVVGNQVKFKTEANPKFYLYGRKLTTLKDSTHLNLAIERGSYLNLNPLTEGPMQPFLNEGANCFNYPYIYKTTERLTTLSFAKKSNRYQENFDTYIFEISKKYNDLIVIGLSDEYTTEAEFFATYKEGNLFFGSGSKAASKRPISIKENEEDKAYMNEFMNEEFIPEILTYGNEFFPNYDNPTKKQLTPYIRISPIKKEKGKIKVGKNNLFTATCEER